METPNAEKPQHTPQAKLNLLGKLLVLVTAIFTFAVALPVTWVIADALAGATYPRVVIIIPIALLGLGFWVACVKLCEWFGVSIETDRQDDR